jgi:PAS domain-containing protein
MPSKTVSFVAREELVDWLEEEADRRMTTLSSAVQQIMAEKYREEHRSASVDDADPSQPHPDVGESGSGEPDDPFERWDKHWWHPDSDTYEYAVRTPDGESRRYQQTREGAASALRELYGDDGGGG